MHAALGTQYQVVQRELKPCVQHMLLPRLLQTGRSPNKAVMRSSALELPCMLTVLLCRAVQRL